MRFATEPTGTLVRTKPARADLPIMVTAHMPSSLATMSITIGAVRHPRATIARQGQSTAGTGSFILAVAAPSHFMPVRNLDAPCRVRHKFRTVIELDLRRARILNARIVASISAACIGMLCYGRDPVVSADFVLSSWEKAVSSLKSRLTQYHVSGVHDYEVNRKLFPDSNVSRSAVFEVFRSGEKVRLELHFPSYTTPGSQGTDIATYDGIRWRTYLKDVDEEGGNVYVDPLKEGPLLPNKRAEEHSDVHQTEPLEFLASPLNLADGVSIISELRARATKLRVTYPVLHLGSQCYQLDIPQDSQALSLGLPTQILFQNVNGELIPVEFVGDYTSGQPKLKRVTELSEYHSSEGCVFPCALNETTYIIAGLTTNVAATRKVTIKVDHIGEAIDPSHFELTFPASLEVFDQEKGFIAPATHAANPSSPPYRLYGGILAMCLAGLAYLARMRRKSEQRI